MKNIKKYITESQEPTLNYNVNPKAKIGRDGLDQVKEFNKFMQQVKREPPKAFKIHLYGLGNWGELTAECIHKSANMYTVKEYAMKGKSYDVDITNEPKAILSQLTGIILNAYKKDNH